MEYQAVVEHGLNVGRKLRHYAGNEYGGYIVAYLLKHKLVGLFGADAGRGLDEFVVLSGDYDGVYAHRASLGRIFYRHLTLGVGAQIGHRASLLAYGRELAQQRVA